jgi:hypothetical protein
MRAALFSGFLLAAAAFAQSGNTTGPCGRACLEGFVNQYLDAVVAHNLASVPIAPGARFTENGQRLPLGDGLWNTMGARGKYRLYVSDPRAGEVVFFGSVLENGTPALMALRLKIENRRISEIESIVARGTGGGARGEEGARILDGIGSPHPVFLEAVPEAKRASRDELLKTANYYFSGIEKDDGKGIYPFTDDCNRLENGRLTTNKPGQYSSSQKGGFDLTALGCKAQLETGFFHFVTRVRDRRFVALDEERQLALAFVFFDHAGNAQPVTMPNGSVMPAGPLLPSTWEIAELFRIEGGKIRRIEAVLDACPYGMNSGWSNWEDGLSSRMRWAGGALK